MGQQKEQLTYIWSNFAWYSQGYKLTLNQRSLLGNSQTSCFISWPKYSMQIVSDKMTYLKLS